MTINYADKNSKWGWRNAEIIDESQSWICGHCDKSVAAMIGYLSLPTEHSRMAVCVCPHCNNATFFPNINGNEQLPAQLFGMHIEGLPVDVEKFYSESRACFSIGAYTASALLARKLLMHVAVEKGALDSGKSSRDMNFEKYVDYLDNANYIPPDGKNWVTEIRKRGNEATHEIVAIDKADAERLIFFLSALLFFVYGITNQAKSIGL